MTPPPSRPSPEEAGTTSGRSPVHARRLSAEAYMLVSLALPGAGHALLGMWRVAAFTAAGFVAAASAVVMMANGTLDTLDPVTNDTFFSALWIALAIWFFAMGDAWHAAQGRACVGPNPRIAFVLNFCTRGLGYFYVQRPGWGFFTLVGCALLVQEGPRLGFSFPAPFMLLVQAIIALHAYRLALQTQEQPPEPPRRRRLLAPSAIVILAAVLAMQVLSAAVQAMSDTNARAAAGVREKGDHIDLEDDLGFTLPSAEWRFEPAHSPNNRGSFVSPRARLVLLRADQGRMGLEGFIVDLAGDIAEHHGPVRLNDQRPFDLDGVVGHELTYEWMEKDLLQWNHLFLIPHASDMHILLVAFPPRLDGRVREDVHSLIRTFRFSR